MRVAGLVILTILLPLSAYAALININTADVALLDTLPGIGPTYAERIIEYRTANGPFVHKEDIQNVSGIGPSTYADIAPLITVGDTTTTTSSDSSATASSTSSSTPTSGNVSTYTPPPSSLSVSVSGAEEAILEVPIRFSARATMKGGVADQSARITWSFGDGSASEGSIVEKTYRYPGTYLVTATASDGPTIARGELVVSVSRAQVRLLPVTGDGITVANDASERLDLSGWWLVSDKGSFRIPVGTTLLPKSSVLFPFVVVHLPVAFDVRLEYPNGVVAARSAEPAPVALASGGQPSSPAPSYEQVQKVEPIISTRANIQAYEEAVGAPAAAVEPTAAGAVPTTSIETAAVADAPATGLLRSPWTLGLLGVMVLAGAAFILL